MIKEKRLVENFIKLVRIDSISREEKQLAEYLSKNIEDLGFDYEFDQAGEKVSSNSGNLIIRIKGNIPNSIPILFSAHMDTVTPGKNINPIIDGEKIKSDGKTILGADNKAAIAAILEALQVLKENNLSYGDMEIVFSICEEIGLKGARYLDLNHIRAKMAFVLDAGGSVGKIIHSAPSQNTFEINIYGKSAHAGAQPEEGINAIQVAGVALSRMRLGRIDEETTSNIGIISGGKATNIVPDKVILKGEVRSRNQEKLINLTTEIKKIVEDTTREFKARAEIKISEEYYLYNLSSQEKVVKLALQAAKKLGLKPLLTSTGGGSDANIFNQKGLPSVVLSIGIEKAHSLEEYIFIQDLKKTTEYILALIQEAKSGEKD
ncbi:MAG: M20/M25/M40 family metallo-hydrolase [Candidatus Caldatribacteriota bacterium]